MLLFCEQWTSALLPSLLAAFLEGQKPWILASMSECTFLLLSQVLHLSGFLSCRGIMPFYHGFHIVSSLNALRFLSFSWALSWPLFLLLADYFAHYSWMTLALVVISLLSSFQEIQSPKKNRLRVPSSGSHGYWWASVAMLWLLWQFNNFWFPRVFTVTSENRALSWWHPKGVTVNHWVKAGCQVDIRDIGGIMTMKQWSL